MILTTSQPRQHVTEPLNESAMEIPGQMVLRIYIYMDVCIYITKGNHTGRSEVATTQSTIANLVDFILQCNGYY